jgi:hypothetical protein
MNEVHPRIECNWQHPSTKLVDQFSTKLAIMAWNDNWCDVNMWHTLLTVLSLLTCTCRHY